MEPNASELDFRVWAVDNVVYGPVDLSTLTTWTTEERITAGTWIFRTSPNTWSPAGKLAELQGFFLSATPLVRAEAAAPDSSSPALILRPGMLRRIKLFAMFSDAQIERFLGFLETQKVRCWAVLFKQGDPSDGMYGVLEGEVRVRLICAGKEIILTTLNEGEFFGEISLFDHGPRSADVVINKDSVLLKISAPAFLRLVAEAPDLATPFLLAVGKTLAARTRADNKRLQDALRFAQAAR